MTVELNRAMRTLTIEDIEDFDEHPYEKLSLEHFLYSLRTITPLCAIIRSYLVYKSEDIMLLFIQTLFLPYIANRRVRACVEEDLRFWGRRVREIDLGSTIMQIHMQARVPRPLFTELVGTTLDEQYPFVTTITHPYGGYFQVGEGEREKTLALHRLNEYVGAVVVERPCYTPIHGRATSAAPRYSVFFSDYAIAEAPVLRVTRSEGVLGEPVVLFETAVQ